MALVDICACGHVRGSHLIRWGTQDFVDTLVSNGHSACKECECSGYTHAITVPTEERPNFRTKPKEHPFLVGLSKADPAGVVWATIECAGCGIELQPYTAILLRSAFYCAGCFVKKPEAYVARL